MTLIPDLGLPQAAATHPACGRTTAAPRQGSPTSPIDGQAVASKLALGPAAELAVLRGSPARGRVGLARFDKYLSYLEITFLALTLPNYSGCEVTVQIACSRHAEVA